MARSDLEAKRTDKYKFHPNSECSQIEVFDVCRTFKQIKKNALHNYHSSKDGNQKLALQNTDVLSWMLSRTRLDQG